MKKVIEIETEGLPGPDVLHINHYIRLITEAVTKGDTSGSYHRDNCSVKWLVRDIDENFLESREDHHDIELKNHALRFAKYAGLLLIKHKHTGLGIVNDLHDLYNQFLSKTDIDDKEIGIKSSKTCGHYAEKYGIGIMYKDGKQYMQINPEHLLVFRDCPILTEEQDRMKYYVRFEDIPSTIE
jgi:hypothetical protein